MNCENKAYIYIYFRFFYFVIPCCWPWCLVYRPSKEHRSFQFLGLSIFFSASPHVFQSLYLPLLSFPLTVTLKAFLLCLFRHTQLSVSFSLPSLPLFSLASSVSLPAGTVGWCAHVTGLLTLEERENTVDMIHHAWTSWYQFYRYLLFNGEGSR